MPGAPKAASYEVGFSNDNSRSDYNFPSEEARWTAPSDVLEFFVGGYFDGIRSEVFSMPIGAQQKKSAGSPVRYGWTMVGKCRPPRLVDDTSALIDELFDIPGPVLAGFDFPIGVPAV